MSSKAKTADMKGEAKPAREPKLRFPKFQDAWEITPIGDKVDLLSGYPFDGPEISQDSSGVRLLRGINITEGRIRHTPEIDRYYTGETDGLEKYRVRVNDLVIGMDGSKVGKNSALISDDDADALLIQRVARVRTSSPALIQFIFQQINSTTFHSYVDKINTSSGIPHISARQIKDFTIGFPSPAEQQKIADCLSSVDELMAAQARKVDALKIHKKGLMQQLFPREGETQPRLRFLEFQNAGAWEVTTIGDLKPFVTSGSRGWAPFYAREGELFVRITNLWRDSIYLDLTDSKFVQLPPGANEGVRTQLKEHDVLISITADIGIIGYVDKSVPSPAYINQHIALVRFDGGQLCGKYVAYFLASEKSQKLFRASTDRGTKAGMSLIGIQKIQLMFPGLPEQQRIASCLSSLDALITAETQKLEALKTHKKGLMQQLFPSPEAVA